MWGLYGKLGLPCKQPSIASHSWQREINLCQGTRVVFFPATNSLSVLPPRDCILHFGKRILSRELGLQTATQAKHVALE